MLDRNSGRCIRGALRNFTRNDKGSNHWRWQNYILHKDKEEDVENRSVTDTDPTFFNCFSKHGSYKSILNFLRKTQKELAEALSNVLL